MTPGRVLTAAKEIPFPKGTVSVQPSHGWTLVNLPVIMSTTVTPLDQTVTLLGDRVRLQGSPVSYLWHHGDGSSQTTSTPGRPYPAKDITHTYLKKADRVDISVDVTYAIRYRVNNGPWQYLAATITTIGPPSGLRSTKPSPCSSTDPRPPAWGEFSAVALETSPSAVGHCAIPTVIQRAICAARAGPDLARRCTHSRPVGSAMAPHRR